MPKFTLAEAFDLIKQIKQKTLTDNKQKFLNPPKRLVDKDAPLTEYDREAIRSVRCENCLVVLKYGSRPYKQKDDPEAPPVFLCKRCLSGREHRYVKPEGIDGQSWKGESKPTPRVCRSIVISDERGKVLQVHTGCGQKTTDWSETGTRTIFHKANCAVHRFKLSANVQCLCETGG